MSTVPLRLVVISARVPTGSTCNGCCLIDSWGHCALDDGHTAVTYGSARPTEYHARSKACRERDGWVAYPPDANVYHW